MIGSELKTGVLRKYGRQFLIILLFEGLTSFMIVTLASGFIGTIILGDKVLAWSFAILLGAIASATAPAATTDVIWEYKTRGPLTRTILGLVALDDALALLLFAFASSFAGRMLGQESGSAGWILVKPVLEIGSSLLLEGEGLVSF